MAGMDEYSDMAVNGRRPAHPLVAELARERLIAIIRAGHEVDIDVVAELLLDGESATSRSR